MPAQVSPPSRVRFAPSPTGYLHIGGLRTALYNYLVARRHGGTFILRIEDTDRSRFVPDAEEDILSALHWAGLEFDEGPDRPGPFGPYRQSERRALYAEHAARLVEEGHAYLAFDTPEEIESMRERMATEAEPNPRYDASTRLAMRNSLSLEKGETERLLEQSVPHVVRLRVDPGAEVRFVDLVRGEVVFATDGIDDQVLVKSDGMPTYHLANVVDDHHMRITHVIRGEEWLPSTPKHILLYRAFGWEPPAMAHLPLILSPRGGKLSKRNADQLGIPVFASRYREAGYEPSALVNYLAFLGWNPGDEREVLTLDELVEAFSIERVGSAGVQFDTAKLAWYNQQHLRRVPPEEIARRAEPALEAAGIVSAAGYLERVVEVLGERLSFPADLATEWRFFFSDPDAYDEDGVRKRWKEDSAALVSAYAESLPPADAFTPGALESALRTLAETMGVGAGRIIHPARLAVSGVAVGPGLFEMLSVLGREACVRRLARAAERLG
jgi:glutamyl-tRNA synthetase